MSGVEASGALLIPVLVGIKTNVRKAYDLVLGKQACILYTEPYLDDIRSQLFLGTSLSNSFVKCRRQYFLLG